ncbi:sialidase family protein [Pareuzebyella sediminis]|uniref:sialidase family protein n=1 Tax=Pareuzebyella sediminis TaxID=2607998 RepID=UPI0011EDB1F7|nr:sialidase family protein [Pareuzebyella sediminis]
MPTPRIRRQLCSIHYATRIPWIGVLCLFIACTHVDSDIKITQRQLVYPVLKSTDSTLVLRIDIVKNDSLLERTLKEVVLTMKGTTDLGDIASVAMYYNEGNDTVLSKNSKVFATSEDVAPHIRLHGNLNLKNIHNYFWLTVSLSESADITHKISVQSKGIITDIGEAKPDSLSNPKHLRMGIALRKHGDDEVHTYRIPGLVTTNKGTLLASYDVRRNSGRDLQGNIDIGISRSTDGGTTWQPMIIALDKGSWGGLPEKYNGVSDANILVNTTNGDIFLAGLWMHGVINEEGKWVTHLTKDSTNWNHQWRNKGSQPGFGVKQTSQFLISKSSDDGKTWSEPLNLTEMCKKREWWLWAPAPGNGITMNDGTLVIPTQGRDENGVPFSNVTYSRNNGHTWKTSEPAYSNTTECAVVELSDGILMLNMRDNRNRENKGVTNGRAIAVTNNLGKSWTEHSTSHGGLQEPVCMASLYKHNFIREGKKKSVLLFSNPNSKNGRHHITIKASLDNGKTWPQKYWTLLDAGQGRGYSSLTSIDEDTIGILYESSQADMTFQKIPLADILDIDASVN